MFDEELSNDHLIPMGTGGSVDGKTVLSCIPCNQERGTLTHYQAMYTNLEMIKNGDIDNYVFRKIIERNPGCLIKIFNKKARNFNKGLNKMNELRNKWREIEIKKLGYSIVGDYRFDFLVKELQSF